MCPNDISSAADNAIFKNRTQNIECCFGCVARSAVLLKLNVANTLLFNFCEQKFVQHGPITIFSGYNGLSLLIFEEKWPNYAFGPKSAPNRDSFWWWQFCLFTYPPRSKWASGEKMIFFLPKSASSVSRSQAHLAKRFQAYTQPYSFDGRIKLSYQIWAKCKHWRNKP